MQWLRHSLIADMPGPQFLLLYAVVIVSVFVLRYHSRLTQIVDMTDASRVGTYTGLYYLFSTIAPIVGPNFNGWIVQLTGGNYNSIMLFAPINMAIACVLMLGVKKGEAIRHSYHTISARQLTT